MYRKRKYNTEKITISIPEIYEEVLQKLIKQKIVANRSEAIREALKEFLIKEFKNQKKYEFIDETYYEG